MLACFWRFVGWCIIVVCLLVFLFAFRFSFSPLFAFALAADQVSDSSLRCKIACVTPRAGCRREPGAVLRLVDKKSLDLNILC